MPNQSMYQWDADGTASRPFQAVVGPPRLLRIVVPVRDPVPDLVAAAWAVDPNHEGGLSDRPHPHRDNADERIPIMYVGRA
jgi:hypothetical protein